MILVEQASANVSQAITDLHPTKKWLLEDISDKIGEAILNASRSGAPSILWKSDCELNPAIVSDLILKLRGHGYKVDVTCSEETTAVISTRYIRYSLHIQWRT